MPHTRVQIDEMFKKLPDDLQEALDSDDMISFLKEIEKKYNLEREQTKELSAEIGMLMLGASSPQHFIRNIQESMEIPEEIAKAITSEVNEKIFRQVKESLKTLYSLSEKEKPEKISVPPTIPKKIEPEIKPVVDSKVIKTEESKAVIADPYREAI